MAVSASKAETLMGRAFRDTFDKETFYALLKHAPDWRRCEQMVRCTRAFIGGYSFHVRLAQRGSGMRTGDEIVVKVDMTEPDFAKADEYEFVNMGEAMAKRANTVVEETYMKIDNE